MRMVIAPGCARSVRLRGSTSRMASICVRQSTRQSGLGTLPPLRPVPEPRVTIGVPLAAASRTQSATCAVVRGNTTADGRDLERRRAVEAVRDEIFGARQDRVGADDELRLATIESDEAEVRTLTRYLDDRSRLGSDPTDVRCRCSPRPSTPSRITLPARR